MKGKEAVGSFSTIDMLREHIKVFSSELKTRLLETRARHERAGIVVYEKGIVRGIVI